MARKIIDGWVIGNLPYQYGMIYEVEGWYEVTIKMPNEDPYVWVLYYQFGNHWPEKEIEEDAINNIIAYKLIQSEPYNGKTKATKSERNSIEQEGYDYFKPINKEAQKDYDSHKWDIVSNNSSPYKDGTTEFFMWADGWDEHYNEYKRQFIDKEKEIQSNKGARDE